MHRSREALSRRRSGPSWLSPRSAVCIIATLAPPELALHNHGWSRFARHGCVCSRPGRSPAARLPSRFGSFQLGRPCAVSTRVVASVPLSVRMDFLVGTADEWPKVRVFLKPLEVLQAKEDGEVPR